MKYVNTKEKEVKMEYVNTKKKIVDIFTKVLAKDAHEYIRGKLGVIPHHRVSK
jgi:hypothetical protein